MIKNRVLIIGVGNHARRIHIPIISNLKDTKITAFVDLQEKSEEIRNYLQTTGRNAPVFFCDKNTANNLDKLNNFALANKINTVIISTPPESHVIYAKWAFTNGYSVLMDKPIHAEKDSAHDVHAASKIHKEYLSLLTVLTKAKKKYPNLVCEVLTQRRFHPAYKFVKETITEIFNKTLCPITYYYAFHNDGQWRMPNEIFSIDYHGFKEGNGKASHSGYHFFDLVNWFSSDFHKSCEIDNIVIKSWPNFPKNYLKQLNSNVLEKVFQTAISMPKNEMEKYGEIDVMSTIQLRSSNNVITHAQVDLLHSGFSARSWLDADNENLYKGNGRVRHEQHYISMGPFASINITSWQSIPFAAEAMDSKEIFKPGHEFNLDITICRNSEVIGGKAVETRTLRDFYMPNLSDYSRGHQEDARRTAIIDFFELVNQEKKISTSSLESHLLSSMLMSGVYESLALKDTVISKI